MPRSDPLVLKKDGEPSNPPITAHKWEPWKVVVVDLRTDKRATKKYFSYVEAKAEAARLQEKYGDKAEVGVVSRQVGYGPPYSKVTDFQLLDQNNAGRYWCPYCRKFRTFNYVPYIDAKRCDFCHTRARDFHVVKCNPLLWDPVSFKRRFGEDL